MFKISNNQIFIKSPLIYDLTRLERRISELEEKTKELCCSYREKRSAHFHRHEIFEYSPFSAVSENLKTNRIFYGVKLVS